MYLKLNIQFTMKLNKQIYNNFLNKIYEYRYTAFKHFMLKNNIKKK